MSDFSELEKGAKKYKEMTERLKRGEVFSEEEQVEYNRVTDLLFDYNLAVETRAYLERGW